MRLFNQIIANVLIITLLLTLAGCGAKEKAENDKSKEKTGGRYLEEEIAFPEGVKTLLNARLISDGSLFAICETAGAYVLLKSNDDGTTWENQAQAATEENVKAAVISPSGEVCLSLYSDEDAASVLIFDTDGNIKKKSFQLEGGGTGNVLWQMEYDSEGELFATDLNGRLYKLDVENETAKEVDLGGDYVSTFGISRKQLFVFCGSDIYVYDTKSLEEIDAGEILSEAFTNPKDYSSDSDSGYAIAMDADDGDAVYYVDSNGIYKFNSDGGIVAQLVDTSMTSLNEAYVTFSGMSVRDERNIFVVASTKERKLYKYSFDENASATPKDKLRVYSLYESNELQTAVNIFKKNNSDIYVELEIGMTGEDSVTAEDAISVLNTKLMSDESYDVIILDGLPVDAYIKKGLLLNIADIVDEVDKADGLLEAVVENAKDDKGNIYALPSKFLIPLIDGDEETLKAAGSLKKLADRAEELKAENPDSVILPYKAGSKGLLGDLFNIDSADFITKDGKPDEKKLQDFLKQAKRLYDIDKVSETDEARIDEYVNGLFGGYRFSSIDNEGYLTDSYKLSFGALSGISEFQLLISADAVSGTSYGLFDSDRYATYIPYLTAGVVAGQNEEAAKLFTKELIGKEAGSDTEGTFPVNKAAFKEICDEKLADDVNYSIGGTTDDGEEFYLDYVRVKDEDIKKLNEIVDTLKTPSLSDVTIRTLVIEEGDKYLRDEQSLDDTVDNILRKVKLYLEE